MSEEWGEGAPKWLSAEEMEVEVYCCLVSEPGEAVIPDFPIG